MFVQRTAVFTVFLMVSGVMLAVPLTAEYMHRLIVNNQRVIKHAVIQLRMLYSLRQDSGRITSRDEVQISVKAMVGLMEKVYSEVSHGGRHAAQPVVFSSLLYKSIYPLIETLGGDPDEFDTAGAHEAAIQIIASYFVWIAQREGIFKMPSLYEPFLHPYESVPSHARTLEMDAYQAIETSQLLTSSANRLLLDSIDILRQLERRIKVERVCSFFCCWKR